MWPFTKRQKDINTLPSITSEEHLWNIGHGTYEDLPIVIRFNSTAKDWAGHSKLPIKLGFAVPFNEPSESGFPSDEENETLGNVEDVIVQEVDAQAKGIFAFVITTDNMREFVFYITEDADIPTIHQTIQDHVSSHEVQCMAVREPKWDAYHSFVGN